MREAKKEEQIDSKQLVEDVLRNIPFLAGETAGQGVRILIKDPDHLPPGANELFNAINPVQMNYSMPLILFPAFK